MMLKEVGKNNKDIKLFIEQMGSSSDTFTYFNTRDLGSLNNHIITILLYEDDNPIGYGHLDKDGETVWLGICIVESKVKLGYGTKLMSYLTNYADQCKINLKLSVHKLNPEAVGLYKKFRFTKTSECDKSYYFSRLFIGNN
jgi:GNAT superfamily N-acetyltransferase